MGRRSGRAWGLGIWVESSGVKSSIAVDLIMGREGELEAQLEHRGWGMLHSMWPRGKQQRQQQQAVHTVPRG